MKKNLYLITGSDKNLIATKTDALIAQVAGKDADAFSLDIIRSQEGITPQEIISKLIRSVLSPPFMGGNKTVCLHCFDAFSAEGTKTSKSANAIAFRDLCRVIDKGISSDIVLILSGADVDKRKGIYKSCKKAKAEIILCQRPKISDRNWRGDMLAILQQKAVEKGMRLGNDICNYLVSLMGTDTGRIDGELEKLICYCGGIDAQIRIEDAREICQGDGESISWSLAAAMGERNLVTTLQHLDVLLKQAKDAEGSVIGLLIQLANHFRHMLQLKILMQQRGLKGDRQVQNFLENISDADKNENLANGLDVVTFNPYRAKMLVSQINKYSGAELVEAMIKFRDAYWKCVSSAVSNRLIIEDLLFSVVQQQPRKPIGYATR